MHRRVYEYSNKLIFFKGHGGSDAINFAKDGYFYKILVKSNLIEENLEYEIKILQKISKLNLITAQLLLDTYTISLSKFFKSFKPQCMEINDMFKNSKQNKSLCNSNLLLNRHIFADRAKVIISPYYGKTCLSWILEDMEKKNRETLITNKLYDICFDTLFTLATINLYIPGFNHNDLHLNNILHREYPATYKGPVIDRFVYLENTFSRDFKKTGYNVLIDFGFSDAIGLRKKNEIKKLSISNNCGRCDVLKLIYSVHLLLNAILKSVEKTYKIINEIFQLKKCKYKDYAIMIYDIHEYRDYYNILIDKSVEKFLKYIPPISEYFTDKTKNLYKKYHIKV